MKVIKLFLICVFLILTNASGSFAGPILGGVVGTAKNEVTATCTPVCKVTNNSSKKIRASLALVSASLTKDLNPGESVTFTLDGKTFDSAFGISVNYL